jgi:hypothetical protein
MIDDSDESQQNWELEFCYQGVNYSIEIYEELDNFISNEKVAILSMKNQDYAELFTQEEHDILNNLSEEDIDNNFWKVLLKSGEMLVRQFIRGS